MLLVKVVEGLLRLFGIGSDKRKRTAGGILGVLGFSAKAKRRGHHQSTTRGRQTQNISTPVRRRGSDLSSYLPPAGGIQPDGTATPPHFLTTESRKNSTYSHPPSVLRPEYANRPYREDSDDEGHIMGPWQYFPSSVGHASLVDAPKTIPPIPMGQVHHQGSVLSPTPAAGGTPGFSRVGGGRAHIDSPYAIATDLTHTFPSVGPQNQILSGVSNQGFVLPSQPPQSHEFQRKADKEMPLSVSNVETGVSLAAQGLPPEAMQPAHVRTKSQTAIIEDYHPSASSFNMFGQGHVQTPPNVLSGMGLTTSKYLSQDAFLWPPLTTPATGSKFMLGDDNDDDSGQDEADHQKKRNKWYHLRKNRPHSSDGRPSTTSSKADVTRSGSKLQLDQELGGHGGSQPPTQRSFIVTRKAQGSMGKISQHGVTSSLGGSPAGYPKASSRPPTR